MDCSPFAQMPSPSPAHHTARRDGWTAARKVRFLDHLAAKGTVRGACRVAGMSAEAAYRLRRRDTLFARGWNAALALAQQGCSDTLATRAIDGIEEDIWFRGELVGTRTRFDSRLLLAHLARLDRLVETHPAGEDMHRFDELLAIIGGTELPEELPRDDDIFPLERDDAIERASTRAGAKVLARAEAERREALIKRRQEEDEDYDLHDEDDGDDLEDDYDEEAEEAAWQAIEPEYEQATRCAYDETAAAWDGWIARALSQVDTLIQPPRNAPAPGLPGREPAALTPAQLMALALAEAPGEDAPAPGALTFPCTVSTVSTSALARALAGHANANDATPRSPRWMGGR